MIEAVTVGGKIQTPVGGLPQLALTKTAPPATNKSRIERGRLLAALQDCATQRLILLKAPAGYGKTTLAVDWCDQLRSSGAIVAWLSVDKDDNEPNAFAYHVTRTIYRAAPELGQSAIDLLAEVKLIASRSVVSAAINSIAESDDEVYLFLDDYHAIVDGQCHELTAFLLRYASSNFHLVISTRTEPPLPVSKLRLTDEIGEVDASSLRFTLAEAEEFLGGGLASPLDQADVFKLHEATEGWPAALQLARIAVRNSPDSSRIVRSFSGASRSISSYIEDTLTSQTDEIVQFLMQTAILDRLHGSLCRAVTGIPHSAEILRALNNEQLLLMTLDEENGWYRYHHLMTDFLKDRLETTIPDRIPELHRRACDWYASQQMWDRAVHHAIAAKDLGLSLQLIEQCAMPLVAKGDLLTLLGWERQLPKELMSGQASVKVALAWGMALVTRFTEADELLRPVEEFAQRDKTSELWSKCRVARAGWYALSGDSAKGREVVADYVGRFLDNFELNSVWNVLRYACWKAGEWEEFYALPLPDSRLEEATYVLAENYRLCLYGMVASHKLQVDEGLRFYADARALAEKHVGNRSVSAVMTTGLSALLQYERGNVSAAEIAVLDELEIIETTVNHESFLSAYLVLVRAALRRGDTKRALTLLNRAERLSDERGWARLVVAFLVERLRIVLRAEDIEAAKGIVGHIATMREQHPAPQRCSWTELHIDAAVAEGLLALATDEVDLAVELLTWAYNELIANDNWRGALRVGADLSIAHDRAGRMNAASTVLKEIVGRAANANVVSFVHERAGQLDHILTYTQSTWSDDAVLTDFGRGLLAGSTGTNGKLPRTAKYALSEREQTILGFIANGKSNKQIARALGVTPETIKTHIKRIFLKLAAKSRAQAVVRAQSLGLLLNAEAG
jgi:LuxR family maltose regulon positive regulatory protein